MVAGHKVSPRKTPILVQRESSLPTSQPVHTCPACCGKCLHSLGPLGRHHFRWEPQALQAEGSVQGVAKEPEGQSDPWPQAPARSVNAGSIWSLSLEPEGEEQSLEG